MPFLRSSDLKLLWIKRQNLIQGQPRQSKREYVPRESHYFLDRRYLLLNIKITIVLHPVCINRHIIALDIAHTSTSSSCPIHGHTVT